MRKTFLMCLVLLTFSIPHAHATEGTCSWHGGVNCSAGPDWDGSTICNDGWTDSGERYFQQIECQQTPMCTPYQWQQMSDTYVMKIDRTHFSSLITLINTLNIEYPMIEIRAQQDVAGRGVTAGGFGSYVSGAQKANKDAVATSTYGAVLLDQKLRAAQMEINKMCIAAGVAKQLSDSVDQQERVRQAQTVLQQSPYIQSVPTTYTPQDINAGTLPGITPDERCVKLSLGTFYNTDKQSCDVCPAGTTRATGTSNCQKPAPIVKREEAYPKKEVQDVKKVIPNEVSSISLATTSPVQANLPIQKTTTFLGRLVSPFQGLRRWFSK